MDKKAALARPTMKSIASYVAKNTPRIQQSQSPGHGDAHSVREADYKGHHIVIQTTYHIEVDGIPVNGHLGVTDDGRVHYHPVPNVSFASAIDMVKRLIDVFPDDFEPGGSRPEPHPHAGHGGAAKGARRGRAKTTKGAKRKSSR